MLRRITQLEAKLTKEELFKKAQERFSSWAKMYSNPEVTAQQMYEDMSCSCYSGSLADDFKTDKPVLDQNFCFSYKGYQFELSACNIITTKEQMLDLINENFKQQFPYSVFTDRYVCWMQGNKDHLGRTKDYVEDTEDWVPSVYLVPGAWSWGAENDLRVCAEVDPIILEAIDKFLETFKE